MTACKTRPAAAGLSLTVLLLFVPGIASAQIEVCDAVVVSRPELESPVTAPERERLCASGVALRLSGASVLRCRVMAGDGEADLPDGMPDYVILVDRPGRDRLVLPDRVMAERFGAFEVYTTDLDGDGAAEQILAAWNTEGIGLGINRWTIRVFDRDWTLLSTFEDVADWSPENLVAAPHARPGCDLAITDFVDDLDTRRGEGLAFRAHFYRLVAGQMIEAMDRPTLSRRYTLAFEAQRTADMEANPEGGNVVGWLGHRSTRTGPPGGRAGGLSAPDR